MFLEKLQENAVALDKLDHDMIKLKDDMSDINKMVNEFFCTFLLKHILQWVVCDRERTSIK